MKRSEMVQRIAIEMMDRLPEWMKEERLAFANEILSLVEENGMLPPEILLDGASGHYTDDYENTWEEENEKD